MARFPLSAPREEREGPAQREGEVGHPRHLSSPTSPQPSPPREAERELILDAGCGTGGLLTKLKQYAPAATLIGIDRDADAVAFAAERHVAPICAGTINALPFAASCFTAIFSADVLYHQAVDEPAALAEFRRCLKPGGIVVLNLPAYDWLSSAHDRAVHGARRYTAGRIRKSLQAAGFAKVTTRYWNSIAFPLMVIRRKVLATHGAESDVMLYPAPVEALFRGLMGLENLMLRLGFSLPFGGSVLAVAVA